MKFIIATGYYSFGTYCRWGCAHEKEALEAYIRMQEDQHTNFATEEAGLFVSTERPHTGASPDSIITCECCGKGTVEVKCPFCFKEGIPDHDKNFCMTKDTTGI